VRKRARFCKLRSAGYLLLLLTTGCLAAGYLVRIDTLHIGEDGPVFRVEEGQIFSLCYIHSMYGVPVTEKFRIDDRGFTLFHVVSSDAALEYFGIESNKENNVRRTLAEFSIPRSSIGRHVLSIGHSAVRLEDLAGQGEQIRIRMARMPVIEYIVKHQWR
jgi:hypothetical protein